MRGGGTESKPVLLHQGGLGEPPFSLLGLRHNFPLYACSNVINNKK